MERGDEEHRSRVSERSERWITCAMWSHRVSTFFFNEMRTSLKKVKKSIGASFDLALKMISLD
jgi:hypothetical protein